MTHTTNHNGLTSHTVAPSVPVLDKRHVDYLKHNAAAVVVQNLLDGSVYFATTGDPYNDDELLVLLGYDEVVERARLMAKANGGKVPTSAQIAKAVNLDHFAMHARGEWPSYQSIVEMSAVLADVIDIRKGA
jgi:hypothetical protein